MNTFSSSIENYLNEIGNLMELLLSLLLVIVFIWILFLIEGFFQRRRVSKVVRQMVKDATSEKAINAFIKKRYPGRYK